MSTQTLSSDWLSNFPDKRDMLSVDEHTLVASLNAGTQVDYPRVCVHELFVEQAVLRPHAEALVFGADRLTYRQLDHHANRIAHFLAAEGVHPGDHVGICMDRSAHMVVSMLGILKAGAGYVPIDPEYPQEHLRFIVEDAAIRCVLTELDVHSVLPTAAPRFCIDGADSPICSCSSEAVVNRSGPESVAAIIYTSGSAGRPKGVCIPHRAIVRTFRNTNYVQATNEDRVAQVASPSFDGTLLEIWLPLLNGGTLIGMRRETLLDPIELTRVLEAERISIMVLNTAYLHQIGRDTPTVLKGVRKILFGGETAEPGPLRALLPHVSPRALVNVYGPAEGCVITTYHEITSIPEHAATIPIGRPVTSAQVYLLDGDRNLAPAGMAGEIYIGGEGVALRYWNRPELSAERFIPDTFSGIPGRLLYRTGDLARMRPDGELEFIGHIDEQVKIRGYRIEPAEVRYVISTHPDVQQVFLMVREDQPGEKRLVAYVTLRRSLVSPQEVLRQHVKSKLPAHMLPAAFVIVDSIPLNTNGKVDKKALPAPSVWQEFANDSATLENVFERMLISAWQDLLRVDHIGLNDNFFDLGGHSLLAARLIARIERETGENIPVAALFEAPTIAQLAEGLRQRSFVGGWSPLVELHMPEASTQIAPFFCVHSLGANLVSFRKVASLLRGDRPIYGLQPHGLDGKQQPLDSIEKMAAAYVAEIRKKQPHGPYYLGGICLGGVVAYEMAQQLQESGEEIAFLALIDSFVPGKPKYLRIRSNLTEYLDRHLGEILMRRGPSRLKYIARWTLNGGVLLSRALGWRDNSSLAQATRRLAQIHTRAIFAYEPKPYSGKITQFMCSDGAFRSYEDRRLAWSTLASGGFEVHIVPGDHLTLVEEPHVCTLAEQLQLCLDRVSGVTGSQVSTICEMPGPSYPETQAKLGLQSKLHSVGRFSAELAATTLPGLRAG
ncbi:MAG: amino acid adenylation domain-containing protein [Acidobacteriaceae bacterium]|nr:amino acid adenylation domain-containing protein [Acidobacteriaceae bacterium]